MNNQCAGVWVKASERLPDKISHEIVWRWIDKSGANSGYFGEKGFYFSNLHFIHFIEKDKYYDKIEWLDETQSSTVTNDKLISELQERAEIAEDELDKIKQSDKISDEEYWKKEFEKVVGYWYDKETPNMDRNEFLLTKQRKAIRDKPVSEHSSAGVWVKASERLPVERNVYFVKVIHKNDNPNEIENILKDTWLMEREK